MAKLWALLGLLWSPWSSVDEGLWPVAPEKPSVVIVVSSDPWHSMIGLPTSEGYEEWGYANRSFYMEKRQGLFRGVNALALPGAAVVEVAHFDHPLADRSEQRPGRLWTFHISEESFRRLKAYLELSRSTDVPILTDGHRSFYPATRDYHGVNQCHHYVARALRYAGIPVCWWCAFSPEGLWATLDSLALSRETVEERVADTAGPSDH